MLVADLFGCHRQWDLPTAGTNGKWREIDALGIAENRFTDKMCIEWCGMVAHMWARMEYGNIERRATHVPCSIVYARERVCTMACTIPFRIWYSVQCWPDVGMTRMA